MFLSTELLPHSQSAFIEGADAAGWCCLPELQHLSQRNGQVEVGGGPAGHFRGPQGPGRPSQTVVPCGSCSTPAAVEQ